MTGESSEQLDFVQAAQDQKVCAVCGIGGSFFDPHHVVEKKLLKANAIPIWHPDNALRLCRRDHDRHTSGSKKVSLAKLSRENIDYAFRLLGAYAPDYLRRYYADTDERVEALAREITTHGVGCLDCQQDYDGWSKPRPE